MTDVEVPEADRIGDEGDGFKIAMSCLDNGRYTVAAGATGTVRACVDASVKYARERKTFGQEIGRYQLVQQMIATMSRDYEICRLLYFKVAWMKNTGVRHTRDVSMAKQYATDAAFNAAHDAIEVHGAYGYSAEYPVERFLRNARAPIIYEGTREVHHGSALARDVVDALERISGMVDETTTAAKEISIATQQQRSASDQVVSAMTQVSDVSRQYVVGSQQSAAAAAQLNDLAGELRESIAQFRVS